MLFKDYLEELDRNRGEAEAPPVVHGILFGCMEGERTNPGSYLVVSGLLPTGPADAKPLKVTAAIAEYQKSETDPPAPAAAPLIDTVR